MGLFAKKVNSFFAFNAIIMRILFLWRAMKKSLIVYCGLLLISCGFAEEVQIVENDEESEVLAEESPVELPELADPIHNFSGMYAFAGAGYDTTGNKIRIGRSSVNFKGRTRNLALFGGVGCGGVFQDKYYLGIDFELFRRSNGGEKATNSVNLVTGSTNTVLQPYVRAHNTLGLAIKSRIGYIRPGCSYMPYIIFGCERFQHQLRIVSTTSGTSTDSNRDTYGSFHPIFGLGIEKKLMNNWSFRTEATYNLGIWDDTGKKIKSGSLTFPYKAKGNRTSFRIMLSKYL